MRVERKFGEDVADVLSHCRLAHEQGAGDRMVGVAFGHECEYLTFAFGEAREGTVGVPETDELVDHLGVDDRAARRAAFDAVEEVAYGADPVLEQVADAAAGG